PATLLGNGTRVPASLPDRAKEIDVLYCGSLKPWKGVDTVVAAMQTLFPWKLTIVGPGTAEDVRRLQQAALAVGVLERVRILPPVSPIDVWDLYARAKVGVIPLPGDGYVEARDFTSPLKLFEMMAAGLPVVASRLNSITEYVTDGREALLVPADDPRPLAAALRKALSDNALRASLSAAARVRAAEYSWENRGRKILAFAQEVIG
ncbi:MAG TPA: glycosyltransferase, partial [Candidatus Polarisedimenticolia bacterium]|nr:glycosyltransferase [Candidatus Polarisedimenticolia bacterium]